MICPNYPDPQYFIFSSKVPDLLYYSHLPAIIISLIIGFFVYFRNSKLLLSRILLSLSVIFSLWAFLNLITWTSNDSGNVIFAWSFLGIAYASVCILLLYLMYVFIDKKDISLAKKTLFLILLLPLIIFTPTQYSLPDFGLTLCGPRENPYFTNYYYGIGLLMFIWAFFLAINRYRKAEPFFKKQILIMTIGVEFFLLTFFFSGFLATYMVEQGIVKDYSLDQYGLFGMTFFMGVLAYMIVKFNAFNVRLLSVQALVATLVILIGSQFAFIRNNTNRILTSITLSLAIGFGWFLIRSVKKEIKQREELEIANMEIEKRNEAIIERNEQLRSANAEITERKDQLQKIADALAVANDKLQKLDTAKTEFVSMASHQLRTPPTSIKGYSSMLLENSYGELNAEQRIAIEHISSANNQQIAFVEDMLNVSRIESGSMKFEFGKFKIEKLCQDVIDILVFKAKDKNIYLDYRAPDAPLPELTIDGAKIREVLSNLVDNAVKYTLRGGVTISTEICAKEEANCLEMPHIRVTISDTGIGIPAEEIPYLFHKFSRGKDISRLNTGGTGLGLYVVKMITQANGGKVWIESPGKDLGTKFMLELPLEQLEETLMKNG